MKTFSIETLISSSKRNINILYTLILSCYILLGWLSYNQYQHNQLLEQRIVELEKTVVVKDEVISSIAEQLGDEIAGLYKKMLVKLSEEPQPIK
jgi:predicted negative regulator of RcsB-dependent stress response